MDVIHYVRQAIPDADDILLLEPEELAGVLLASMKKRGGTQYSRHNFMLSIKMNDMFPPYQVQKLGQSFAEAWAWLEREGLLITSAQGDQAGWQFISRRGESVADPAAFASFRKASLFPRSVLHPVIDQEAWPSFIRGRFDTAVFEAFREIEVAVREAGGFDARMVGTELMRAAFHSKTGPLADQSLPKGERDALGHLFAGAIGSYKNPVSHRRVGRVDAAEAGECLILASHLLRIVDDRRPKT